MKTSKTWQRLFKWITFATSMLVVAAEVGAAEDSTGPGTKELGGKVAIVTGSTRNLGRAYAVALARMGANVVVHYHLPSDRTDAESTVELVKNQGVRTLLVSGDLSQLAVITRMFDATFEAFGRVDIVVNSAGAIVKKPLAEVSEDEFDRCFGINAKAPFFIMQQAARRMSDHGRIINIGTSLLASTTPNYSAYAGSKAPIEQFTRALAKEIGARGITVNCVAPGPIDTPFYHDQETPESTTRAKSGSVGNRLGRIEDVVPMVEFLASSRSQWITAQTIFVNGGYVAR